MTHPGEDVDLELEEPERGGEDPDVEDGHDGEDEGPEERGRDGHEGGEEAVQPQLRLREHHEGQAPHEVEALRRLRLGQHVGETKLKSEQISLGGQLVYNCAYTLETACAGKFNVVREANKTIVNLHGQCSEFPYFTFHFSETIVINYALCTSVCTAKSKETSISSTALS